MEVAALVLAVAVVLAALIVARGPGARPGDAPTLAAAGMGAQKEAFRSLQEGLGRLSEVLSNVAGRQEEIARRDDRMSEMFLRMERLFAGSYSRGRGGENLLAAALAEFPQEMLVRNFTIGGRVCEFALRMSDGKVLPIDSKWPGGGLLSGLEAAQTPEEQEVVRRQIERAVCARLKEVAAYIDPSLTLPMAVTAVPDGAFACLRKAHDLARQLRVVIVSYSLALPYLLSLWHLHRTYTREIDGEQLLARVRDVTDCLLQMSERIESHLSKGLTMAQNAAGEMKTLVSAAKISIDAIARSEPSRETFPPIEGQDRGL